jgi:threonine dehydratase
VLRTRVPDRPGELAALLDLLAGERVNVVEVEHQRESAGVPVGHTGVELTLLTRDPGHCEQLVAQMREWGYPVERLD